MRAEEAESSNVKYDVDEVWTCVCGGMVSLAGLGGKQAYNARPESPHSAA